MKTAVWPAVLLASCLSVETGAAAPLSSGKHMLASHRGSAIDLTGRIADSLWESLGYSGHVAPTEIFLFDPQRDGGLHLGWAGDLFATTGAVISGLHRMAGLSGNEHPVFANAGSKPGRSFFDRHVESSNNNVPAVRPAENNASPVMVTPITAPVTQVTQSGGSVSERAVNETAASAVGPILVPEAPLSSDPARVSGGPQAQIQLVDQVAHSPEPAAWLLAAGGLIAASRIRRYKR